ncbi:MAG: nuclear transport factor 2 family protein [Caulobacteraceae bacterium]|nr:nuclear transport factor 2 family protein [Caulobacter sp.]
MSTPDRLAVWTTYQSAWSAIPDAERRDRLARSVASDCAYADPQTELQGLEALVEKIAQSQAATPGASFRNDRLTDYGDQALSEWTMLGPKGERLVQGASHARFGADGRLTRMTGFFRRPGSPDGPQDPTPAARNWDVYQAAWARVSAAQRRSLLAAALDAAAVYADPGGAKTGLEALGAYIDATQDKAPGVWFRQTLFLEHHGQALSRWERLTPDGEPPVRGASYARFAPDGRVLQMSGFPNSVPEGDVG